MATPSARMQAFDRALAVACPTCGAAAHDACVKKRRRTNLHTHAWPPHKARVDLVAIKHEGDAHA